MSKPYEGRHPVVANVARKGLSNEDMVHVAHGMRMNARGSVSGLARTKSLLEELGIRPGCVVRCTDRSYVFTGIYSVMYATARHTETLVASTPPIFVYGSKRSLMIALVEPPIDGFLHRGHAVQKLSDEISGDLKPPPNFARRVTEFFASRLSADQIRHETHGEYWEIAAFKLLWPDFVAQLADRHA